MKQQAFITTFIALLLICALTQPKEMISPLAKSVDVRVAGLSYVSPTPTKTPSPTPTLPGPSPTPGHTQKEIEEYIKTIFGKDGKVAIAVSRNECSPTNKYYPKCVYHTEKEYSVGIFQINLFNKTHSIHATKVPGKTMEEKIESLKDPYINTLVAFKIYTSSGFNPWSAYTNGNYKRDI